MGLPHRPGTPGRRAGCWRSRRRAAAAVTVSLATGTGLGGEAAGDVLANVENVTGSAAGDRLTGDGNGNVPRGNAGNDTLIGGAGADSLGGGGNTDRFVFVNGFGNDTVSGFGASDLEDVDLSGVANITGFSDLMADHLQTDGGTGFALIVDGASSILLRGIAVAEIGNGLAYSADDFIF